MPYNPDKQHRRSIRLKDYDYTQGGAYFVTICTGQREYLFGEIHTGMMRCNIYGEIAAEEWQCTPQLRACVELDVFVVMPNHIHGIILITRDIVVGAQRAAPLQTPHLLQGVTANNVTSGSLGAIVRAFKSAVTKRINEMRDTPAAPIWQRNYYEHVIRSEDSCNYIRHYVATNPERWEEDSLYIPP